MITETGKNISKAVDLLRQGKLVGLPTETVYGLAANAYDATAVARVFEVKERPFFDPLIVHCASIERISDYVIAVPMWAKDLLRSFSPGPITVVLKKRGVIPDIVTAGLDTVGIRIPDHPMTLQLLDRLDFPLAAPSANPFGYVSPTTANHVFDQLAGKIPYILDGGNCTVGVESTIIGEIEGKPTILRLGGISVEQIEEVVGEVKVRISSSRPSAPGMLESHYSPQKKVIIGLPKDIDPNAGYISFSNTIAGITTANQRLLSATGDLKEAAQNIFSVLRELDKMPVDRIYAELLPEVGLGRAINDRLRRAAN